MIPCNKQNLFNITFYSIDEHEFNQRALHATYIQHLVIYGEKREIARERKKTSRPFSYYRIKRYLLTFIWKNSIATGNGKYVLNSNFTYISKGLH